jgi:hypothetical protein
MAPRTSRPRLIRTGQVLVISGTLPTALCLDEHLREPTIGGGYDGKIVGCFGLKEQAAQNTSAGGGRTYSVLSCWSSC